MPLSYKLFLGYPLVHFALLAVAVWVAMRSLPGTPVRFAALDGDEVASRRLRRKVRWWDQCLAATFGLSFCAVSAVGFLLVAPGIRSRWLEVDDVTTGIQMLIYTVVVTCLTIVAVIKLLKSRAAAQSRADYVHATGTQLGKLRPDLWRVYHDLKIKGRHLEHLAIGRPGLFLIKNEGLPLFREPSPIHPHSKREKKEPVLPAAVSDFHVAVDDVSTDCLLIQTELMHTKCGVIFAWWGEHIPSNHETGKMPEVAVAPTDLVRHLQHRPPTLEAGELKRLIAELDKLAARNK